MRISDWSSDVCSSDLVSNRWQTGIGEIGVLLGAQFERYYSGGYQVSTNSYADVTNLFDVDGDGATGGSGDTVTMPTQVRPRYETGNRVRSGFYGAVQWRPSDALELHLDKIGRASCRERVCQYV